MAKAVKLNPEHYGDFLNFLVQSVMEDGSVTVK
jgi:hypothetical protein